MSRPLAGALFALALAGFGGSGFWQFAASPSRPTRRTNLGRWQPRPEQGLGRLEKADRLEIKSPELARNEQAAALKDFQTAATAKPDNYRAHNGAGYALRKLGDYDRALEPDDRALTLAPASSEAIEDHSRGVSRAESAGRREAVLHAPVRPRSVGVERADESDEGVDRAPSGGRASSVNASMRLTHGSASAICCMSVGTLGHNSPDWK